MRISNSILGVTLIVFLAGLSVSEVTFAGGGHRGGGHSGSWRGSGGWHGGGSWHGSRVWRGGIYMGLPIGLGYGFYPYSYYGGPYYGTPYYALSPAEYPPVPPAPIIYTEQSDDPQANLQEMPINAEQSNQGAWWYYCTDAKAYYPQVSQCPEGWMRVAPQPPSDIGSQPVLNNPSDNSATQ